MAYEFRNAVYSSPDGGQIDVEINHPDYGWIPFTARPDDPEPLGRELYDLALAGDVAAYVPPEIPPEPLTPLTARQLRIGLVLNGFALDQVEASIDAIEDEQDRSVAKIEWEYASQFNRYHPFIEQVGAALGLTPEQIDTMWEAALSL